jgi:hypothetical protein
MYTSEIEEFIHQHSDLFWYTPEEKKTEVSAELLLETILNYGTLSDFKRMEQLMGLNTIATIFFKIDGRKKMNYFPEIYNFFYLYLKKHAQGDTK